MEERIVAVGSVSLATKAWLRPDGPCVVLVHGLGTNLDHWGSLIPLLRDWCTVVAFDRRGHGRTSPADRYRATDFADDIAAVVDAYDIVDPILVGHSGGAWDCLSYAARSGARMIICLDQAIASEDPVWRASLEPQDPPADARSHTAHNSALRKQPPMSDTAAAGTEPAKDNPPTDTAAHCYTDTEVAARMTQGRAELGERLWNETYGPMNERALSRNADGLLYYRPEPSTLRAIRSDYGSFVAGGEPYDSIVCPVVVVLADRNSGPIHDALRRVVARRGLVTVDADTTHDIHVHQPQLIADLIRESTRTARTPPRGA